MIGLPDRNRTCDPQLRRLLLYPTELRAVAWMLRLMLSLCERFLRHYILAARRCAIMPHELARYALSEGHDLTPATMVLQGGMKGRAVVSVNRIPEMREAFKGVAMRDVSINYSVGGAGRVGAPKGELIVGNCSLG